MLKSDEEVENLLSHKNNGLNKIGVQVKIMGHGQHGNQGNREGSPHKLRKVEDKATVGILANLIGNRATSELLDVSRTTVQRHADGLRGDGVPIPELKAELEERLDKVSDKVAEKIDTLIDIFTETKMEELKASEIPSSADKLVNVFDKLRRRNENMNGNGTPKPQVILYAPKQINIEQLVSKEV